MIRIIIENIILFLLPTALYLAYKWLTSADSKTHSTAQALNDAPLIWLAAIGSVLVVVTLAVFGSNVAGKPGQDYRPAVLRDGKVVPGEIK